MEASNTFRKRAGGKQCESLHAEMNTVLRTIKSVNKGMDFRTNIRLSPSTIYVARIMADDNNLPSHKSHRLGNSKPCIKCQQELPKYNVTRVFHTDVIDGVEVLCELRLE